MIDFDELRKEYEQAVGYTVFAEEGELLGFYRERNNIEKPICGIYSINPATMTAIQKPFMGIVAADITMLSPPDKWEEVRDKLNEVARILNGTAISLRGDDGDEYSVAYNCQTCAVGDRILDVSSGCGELFPITQSISYIIIQRGVSAYEARLWIDGNVCALLSLVENKVHTTSMYSSSYGDGQTASEAEAYGIDFTSPYTKDSASEIIRRAINENTGNEAHSVVVEKGGKRNARIMAFSHASDTISPPQNIGFNVSMTEVHPVAADYNGRWSKKTSEGSFARLYLDKIFDAETGLVKIDVYWGDGASDSFDITTEAAYHVYNDGKESHVIRVFKIYDSDLITLSEGMDARLEGVSVVVRTYGDEIYASDISTENMTILSNGKNATSKEYRAIRILGGRFYQQIGTDTFPLGVVTKEGANYIPDGYVFECVVDLPTVFSEFATTYLQVPREAVYTNLPEG